MSKVLILQGSPRANGNTTWMVEEYKKAAEAAGHEVRQRKQNRRFWLLLRKYKQYLLLINQLL